MSSILRIVIRLLLYLPRISAPQLGRKTTVAMFSLLDIVLGYCKDFRGGWYLDREGILINLVSRKNWHYPLYWQKPTSARPGHCIVSFTTVISFEKNHQQQARHHLRPFKFSHFSAIIDLFCPYGHLLDAEMNPKVAKLTPHWLLAKWGLVPGDSSGQLPYYFSAYFKQFGILRKKEIVFLVRFK